ncbi:MAG TPA: type II secretion system protein GspM [Gammaproteobacteria bacterium]
MHPEKLSAKQQRLLALALLLTAVSIVVGAVVVPYFMVLNGYDEGLRHLDERMVTYRAIVRDGEVAREQQRQLDRIELANGYFLASGKQALASAELQRRVKLVIEQSGGSVVSSQMLGERNDHDLDQVVLRVQMRSGVEQLGKVLHSLEGQPPVVMLDNVLIGARPAGGFAAQRGKETEAQLDVRFDVAGFLKPSADGSAAKK